MFAARTKPIEMSGIRKMFERAPPGAINLGLGEPDFPPPPHIIEALNRAIREGHNRYGPTGGLPELRAAVAEKLQKKVDFTADNVLITVGATEALCLTMQSFVDPGDEVLMPNPGFVLFAPHITLAGGRPVHYPLRKENGYVPRVEDLQRLVTPRTKAVIMNTPSNPCGSVMDRRAIKEVAAFAREEDLLLVADEVYDAIVYDDGHESFLGTTDKIVYVNSFSKSYAMTGWRLGYLAAPKEFVQVMAKVHYYFIACPPTPTQYAVLEGLRGPQDYTRDMVKEFRARRDLVVKELNTIRGFECLTPRGAFYAFPSYDFDVPSERLADEILEEGVICSPGSAFGSEGEGHLRFSYANSQENIRKGLSLVRKVAERHTR